MPACAACQSSPVPFHALHQSGLEFELLQAVRSAAALSWPRLLPVLPAVLFTVMWV